MSCPRLHRTLFGIWILLTFFGCSFLLHAAEDAPNGGTIVLAHCNAYVEFTVVAPSTEDRIVTITKLNKQKDTDCARFTISTDGAGARSEKLCGSTLKVYRGKSVLVRITNQEKGQNEGQCGGSGPRDGDIRVDIPKDSLGVTYNKLPSQNSCDVCKANFEPKYKIY